MNISTRQIRFSTAKAFTLIELLTVVAIIAILMGLLLPVIGSVKDAARRTQAKNDLNQIVTGVRNFYTEYGIYPLPTTPTNLQGSLQTFIPGSGGTGTGTPTQDELMNVLRANNVGWDNTGSTNLNPRRIVYLEVPYVKDPTSPRAGIQNTNPPTGYAGDFYDPWGTPYIVFIDGTYSNSITPTSLYKYSDQNMFPLNLGVAGLSYGKDMGLGKAGNKVYAGSDDVISWQ